MGAVFCVFNRTKKDLTYLWPLEAGATILGEGKVALILELLGINKS
jgi:hypothetical protein